MSEQQIVTKTTTEEDTISQVDEATLNNFTNYVEQFLQACCSVWPESDNLCKVLLKWQLKYGSMASNVTIAEKKEMLDKWHANMSPYYDFVRRRDSSFMAKLDPSEMHGVDICALFHDKSINQQTRDTFWDYLSHINRVVQMGSIVSSCPGTVMSKITSVASGIAEQIESGSTNLKDIDILGLGKQVAESMSQEELTDFTSSMMSNAGNIQNLYSNLQQDSGAPNMPNLGGLGGMMSMLMGSLGGGGGGPAETK